MNFMVVKVMRSERERARKTSERQSKRTNHKVQIEKASMTSLSTTEAPPHLNGVEVKGSGSGVVDAARRSATAEANAVGGPPNLHHQHARLRVAFGGVTSVHLTDLEWRTVTED